jgi:hypothetical protein
MNERPSVTYCPHNPDQFVECEITACPCCGGLGVAAMCTGCNGTGAILVRTAAEAHLAKASQFERCETCKGRGYFPISLELFERLGFAPPADLVARGIRKPNKHAAILHFGTR